jgi:CheY-like chemotaxis protein
MINWKDRHVLIAEDDFLNFTLLADMLEHTGIRITHAETGAEAVDLFARDNTIDIVLMDMRLPEMDGYQATRHIKEAKKDVPVIAQTAYAFSEDRAKCVAAGCDEYINKPISLHLLIKLMSKFLNQA